MSKLYLDNGFVDMEYIFTLPFPFTFVIGGRGTGKTYGALQQLLKCGKKFLILRRTQTQAEVISKEEFNPFKVLQKTIPYQIHTNRVNKYIAEVYAEYENDMDVLGYIGAVSTFANIRGFDLSDIDIIIYDEFIPEKHQIMIKNEENAVFNIYETVNRNRELTGQEPVKFVALSNSDTVDNPLFMSLGIVDRVLKMQDSDSEILRLPHQQLCVVNLRKSEISERKRQTVLYQLTSRNSKFQSMALDNNFADTPDNIKQLPIKEYNIDCQLAESYIYYHKTDKHFYVTSYRKAEPPYNYKDNDRDLKAFRMDKPYILRAYYEQRIYFETAQLAVQFKNLLKL